MPPNNRLALFWLLALTTPTAAWSDDCHVPLADWLPRDAVAHFAQEQGWTVRSIKIDDGCYEIRGRNGSGRRLEVKLHPSTLQIIAIENEHDEHDGDDEDAHE